MRKILVVDDDILIRTMIRKELERLGYEVEVASDGDRALARLRLHCYDLVMTDLNMPNLGGIELIKTIRAGKEPCSQVPIICITGEDVGRLKPQAVEAGAIGWVQKPFNPDTWGATLEKLIGR